MLSLTSNRRNTNENEAFPVTLGIKVSSSDDIRGEGKDETYTITERKTAVTHLQSKWKNE